MRSCHKCFKILSDKNRLILVSVLRQRPQRVSDLLKRFDVGQPTISYHLAALKRVKMTKSKKTGRQVYYSLNRKYPCKGCRIFENVKC